MEAYAWNINIDLCIDLTKLRTDYWLPKHSVFFTVENNRSAVTVFPSSLF